MDYNSVADNMGLSSFV